MTEKQLDKIRARLRDAQFGYDRVDGPMYYKDVTSLLEERTTLLREIARLEAKLPPEPTEAVS